MKNENVPLSKSKACCLGLSLLVFAIFALAFVSLSVFDVIESAALDFRFFLRDPSEKSEKIGEGVRRSALNPRARKDIVILGIDENTVREFSDEGVQWPFPWSVHARFVDYVSTGNPSAVFFDINFIDHKPQEAMLAASMKRAGNVFIDYSFENTAADTKYEDNVRRVELTKTVGEAADTRSLVEEIVPPTPMLSEAAAGTGFSNVFPNEVDNVVRQMPIVLAYNGKFYPNIDLTLAMHYYGITAENVEVRLGEYVKLTGLPQDKMARPNSAGEIAIPIDSRGFMDVNYIGGAGNFQSFSYSYFVRDGSMAGNDSLKDKIVMAGAYSVTGIATDLHKSPYGTTFGIEHHANALNTILNQDFLRSFSQWENIALMFFLAIVCGLAFPRLSIIKSALFAAALGVAHLVVSYVLFDAASVVNAMVTPVIQISFAFTLIGIYRLTTEQNEKKYIRQTFSKFVSKSVVDELLRHPEKLKLGGEKKTLTVLFSDIRSFTSLSEKLSPEALVEHLNSYLQKMTDIVLATNGTLDKYVGDEIMAFWGAPTETETHALDACRCAIAQMDALRKLNEAWTNEGKPTLNIGIGINTGSMVVGNMGSSSRMDYTLMGDNVNLGSRLEGTNKVYGTNIIISENTYEYVKEHVVVRELDLIRVKGKEQPVRIYELIDMI